MKLRHQARSLRLVWVAVVVVAATACAAAPQPSAKAGSGLARVGGPAPVLSLPLLDGGTDDLVRERGKVVLLNFWATWCVPSCQEMPELRRLADDLHAGPFTLLTIDL